ncbi:MAG: hypothetical protein J0M04_07945 [Verrucomicrobia bacterium]|nr:hypothetical protein [Verrucomicrobiota bacterium]
MPAGTTRRNDGASPVSILTRLIEDHSRDQNPMGAPQYNPYNAFLSDWSDAEILAVLEKSLRDPQCMLPGGCGENIPHFLLGEWLRRDADAALAWLQNHDDPRIREVLTKTVACYWPTDRAEEGLRRALSKESCFGSPRSYANGAIAQSAKRGAAEVANLLELLASHNLDNWVEFDFPDHFDFKSLVATDAFRSLLGKASDPKDNRGSCNLYREWFNQDRNKAFGWLAKQDNPIVWQSLFPWDDCGNDHYVWLAGALDAADGPTRDRAMDAFQSENRAQSLGKKPETALRLLNAVHDPELAARLRTDLTAQAIYYDVRVALPLLENLSDPSARIALLEKIDFSNPNYQGGFGFPDSDKALFRAKLVEWGATPEKVEAIIQAIVWRKKP